MTTLPRPWGPPPRPAWTGRWTPAYDSGDQGPARAWVTEVTSLFNLPGWPAGMRLIVRNKRPHPGAQLADHRLRRHADRRVRHQHDAGPARRTGSAPPSADAH